MLWVYYWITREEPDECPWAIIIFLFQIIEFGFEKKIIIIWEIITTTIMLTSTSSLMVRDTILIYWCISDLLFIAGVDDAIGTIGDTLQNGNGSLWEKFQSINWTNTAQNILNQSVDSSPTTMEHGMKNGMEHEMEHGMEQGREHG